MNPSSRRIAGAAALVLAAAFTVATSSAAGDPAAAYCVKTGGDVEDRAPAYGTNGPVSSWLILSGVRQFCRYTASDGSHIHLLLNTLYTTKPALATLAYYARVPVNPGGGGNPASYYCSQLGGSDLFGGVNAAGGGWVARKGTPDETLETCIFPDMSSIDSWGLTYNANGIIRGIDLTTVLRYQPPASAAP